MMFGRKLPNESGSDPLGESAAEAVAESAPVQAAAPAPVPTAVPAAPRASSFASRHSHKPGSGPAIVGDRRRSVRPDNVIRSENYNAIRQAVFASLDIASALTQPVEQVSIDVQAIVGEIVRSGDLPVTQTEQRVMVQEILNDMFGVGPIEPLLQDETVDDIMVNGPDQVYVERFGKLELTDVKFRDNLHVVSVAQRIAASVGRRVDESSP